MLTVAGAGFQRVQHEAAKIGSLGQIGVGAYTKEAVGYVGAGCKSGFSATFGRHCGQLRSVGTSCQEIYREDEHGN